MGPRTVSTRPMAAVSVRELRHAADAGDSSPRAWLALCCYANGLVTARLAVPIQPVSPEHEQPDGLPAPSQGFDVGWRRAQDRSSVSKRKVSSCILLGEEPLLWSGNYDPHSAP